MNEVRKVTATNMHSGDAKTYPSVTDASKRTRVKRSRIIECLQGKRRSAGGYVWQFIE